MDPQRKETDQGTVHITHNKPTASDAASSALFLTLEGASTAAQGILIDTSSSYLTSSKLLNLKRNGSEVMSLSGAGTLRLGGGGAFANSGMLEVRGDFNEALSPVRVEVNRDRLESYRPISLFGRFLSNTADPFDVAYQGASSILNYGEGASGTVKGTATASESFIDVYDSDNQNSEYGGVRVGINMSPGGGSFLRRHREGHGS